jgi:putative transposase
MFKRDQNSLKVIKKYFHKSKDKYGIRQLKMVIKRSEDLVMNHKRIARIKHKFGLVTKIRKKNIYRKFAKKKQEHETCPNLLDRKFRGLMPNQVYSTDITTFKYNHKKVYLAAVKDLGSKDIVGFNISNRIDLKLSNTAIDKALNRLSVEEKANLMIHSDQGFHYTHFSYRKKLKDNGITQSMSRKGNCIDNSPIESFFGLLKDHIDLQSCKNLTEVKKEVTKKIKYYNKVRPQLGLKKMPPSEYRRHLGF